MSTWYRTWKYNTEIATAEVLSETDKYIVLAPEGDATQGGWFSSPRRVLKGDEYHRTFADARLFLLNRAANEIEHHKRWIDKLRNEYDKVFMLERPTEDM
jgi:hypothetical protein